MSALAEPAVPKRQGGVPWFAIPVLLLVCLLYWPVHGAGFVWDDRIFLHDNAQLWAGDSWLGVVFHGIADWKSYFRPLGLALFVAEARGFAIAPGPMHLLSLAFHLLNTWLVGALAIRLRRGDATSVQSKAMACAATLVYGLHPALIETVCWISSQFDLVVILFMLLGLWMNLSVQRRALRAGLVGGCFFLAACTKETAIAFPILLVLLDWLGMDESDSAVSGASTYRSHAGSIVRRQWPVYAVVLIAGIAYLVLRHWALAGMVAPAAREPFLTWQRLQTVCFTYLVYWRLIIWPFVGLSPEHVIPAVRFVAVNPASILTDIVAVVIGVCGSILTFRRRRLGVLIVGVTAVLFPVLHVIPVGFDESLYHERYAAPAVAFACILLPGIGAVALGRMQSLRFAVTGLAVALALWLVLAAVNVRVTTPLWANDVTLWRWAVKQNPDDPDVRNHLLAAYIDANDQVHANQVADSLMDTGQSCPSCMLNVAYLALARKDVRRATMALRKANDAFAHVVPTPTLIVGYVIATGNLHQLEHKDGDAEGAYRAAISLDPTSPEGYMCLALLKARQGEAGEARAMLDRALALSAPDDIPSRRAQFEAALATTAVHR